VPDGLHAFLELLKRVLVLRDVPNELEDALALDFYTIPREGVDPTLWPHTEVGDLVNRMKYRNDPTGSAHARDQLADRMARVIEHHPSFRASVLLAAPGHSQFERAHSELLAQAIGYRLGQRVVRVRTTHLVRPESKARSDRVDLRGEFVVDQDEVAHREVLILDDVYGRGTTMRGIAHAAARAGARVAHGLVAARTIR
jgi:predicted amidophosphoribosyltransferase